MNIKYYLKIINNLPDTPYHYERFKTTYLLSQVSDVNKQYDTIEFIQIKNVNSGGIVKYSWSPASKINIDYKVDDIKLFASNDIVYYEIINLLRKYKFKFLSYPYKNYRGFHIDFNYKGVGILESKTSEDYYYVDDSQIIESIFFESLNEYSNGVPLIWGD